MIKSLYDQVIGLIPSGSLKKTIKANKYILSDITLLSIAYQCSPDYETRLKYLELLRDQFTGKVKQYAENLIISERNMLKCFYEDYPDAVFELHIKESTNSYDEKYLCASVESALKMIPMFYKEYEGVGFAENELSKYKIVKRRVFSGADEEPFSEDRLGDAVFLPGNILYSVYVEEYLPMGSCSNNCLECDGYCLDCIEVEYPCFTKNGDVVEYIDLLDCSKHFGVVLQNNDNPAKDLCIIPLGSDIIHYHDFENVFYVHKHCDAPFVETISPDRLPEKIREDYFAFLQFINNEKQE